MNRGSAVGRLGSFASDLCFNEAPIHESGKFGSPFTSRSKPKRLQ